MKYYEQPEALYGDDPKVLAVVNMHPNELFPQLFRREFLREPIPGVALVDGFPDAARQGSRCLNGIQGFGNLNMQFNYDEGDVAPSDGIECETLKRTRNRADELLTSVKAFDGLVVDLHGCFDCYPSNAWMGDKPTTEVLALICELECKEVIISPSTTLSGALGNAVAPEVSDADAESYIGKMRRVLGASAAGDLTPVNLDRLREIRFFKCVGYLFRQDLQKLSIKPEAYRAYQELPDRAADFFGYNGSVACLAERREGMEVVASIALESLALPATLQADDTEAAA